MIPWLKTGVPLRWIGPVPSPSSSERLQSLVESPPSYLEPWLELTNFRLPENDHSPRRQDRFRHRRRGAASLRAGSGAAEPGIPERPAVEFRAATGAHADRVPLLWYVRGRRPAHRLPATPQLCAAQSDQRDPGAANGGGVSRAEHRRTRRRRDAKYWRRLLHAERRLVPHSAPVLLLR